jgi:hypothetical protein
LAAERVERKLAAVLAADIAGYSRLMGADEEGTLARLKATMPSGLGLDGVHRGPRWRAWTAFAGAAGDIRRVAMMGETLRHGELIGRFAPNAVAVAGPGDALTFATVAQEKGEHNAIYCRCLGPAR